MPKPLEFAAVCAAVFAAACGIAARPNTAQTGTQEFIADLGGRPATLAPIGWPQYGGDAGQTRSISLAELDSVSVRRLEPAWTWWSGDVALPGRPNSPTVRPGSFEASPLVVNDTLYVVTPLHRVAALDAPTGRELWRFDPNSATRPIESERGGFTHRGLAAWIDGTHRYLFLPSRGRLFAIDAASGRPVDSFGARGSVLIYSDLLWPVDSTHVYNTSPPVVSGDLVIVGFTVADRLVYDRDPPGALRAFDARTGAVVWTWSAMPQRDDPAIKTWEDSASTRTGHMNVWSPFTLDAERALLFVPVSAPSNDNYGGRRLGDNLYSQSIVCLDAKTGRRRWHFQFVHHDVWDYDPAAPPVLVTSRQNGKDVPAVAVAGKTGFVYVFERETGVPLWPIVERAVDSSDVPGERLSVTQPVPTKPAPFARQGITEKDLVDFTPEIHDMAVAKFRALRHGPLFTPPSTQGTIVVPGWIGGAGWGATAYDPATRTLYVKASNQPSLLHLITPARGERTVQGRFVQDTVPIGADALSDLLVPYPGLLARLRKRVGRIPLVRPPYGTLTAIDMDSGDERWQVVVGDSPGIRAHPALRGLNLPPLGVVGAAGPSVTLSGLIFLTGGGRTLYALERTTGRTLWEHDLGAYAPSNPVLFRVANGRPYVVIAVGGPPGTPPRLMAFTLR